MGGKNSAHLFPKVFGYTKVEKNFVAIQAYPRAFEETFHMSAEGNF